MARESWYSNKKKPTKKEGHESEGGPESMHERHGRERGEAHQRHSKAREDMHKQHEEELSAMAERQAGEMQQPEQAAEGTPGGAPAPGAMNTAGAGAAPGTPPAVAGTQAA